MQDKITPKPQHAIPLNELVKDSGALCITLGVFDYISIGASIFVALRVIKNSQVGITVIAPKTEKINRHIVKK